MSFLAPLFLLGALTIALPILAHLIRRQVRDKIPFSSLMFLAPSPPRVTRRSRLENILLLILRCAVLGLLALGFARPFFSSALPDSRSNSGETQTVVLLDTSASMRREPLWRTAVAAVEKTVREALPTDQIAIMAFDQKTTSVMQFSEWSALPVSDRSAVAAQRVNTLNPGWAATDTGQALVAAVETLGELDNRATGLPRIRRIIVVTDLQAGTKWDAIQGYDWPRDLEVHVEIVRPRKPTNAGLQLLWNLEETALDEPGTLAHARVISAGDSKTDQFELRWDPPLASNTALTRVQVPAGQVRVIPILQGPIDKVPQHLVLAGDDADFDNHGYLVVPQPAPVSLWYLGNESDNDPTQLAYYLRRAFQDRRQRIRFQTFRLDQPLPAAPADLALVVISETPVPAVLEQVNALLRQGKQVLVALKNTNTGKALGRLAGNDALVVREAAVTNYAMLAEIQFDHPFFSSFADPRFSDFTKIHFWKYRKVELDALRTARVLARFESRDPALFEVPIGNGRLIALTSGWQPGDSQLALSTKFVPLLYNILASGHGTRTVPASYLLGEAVDLATLSGADGATNATISVLRPDGKTVPVPAGQTRFHETDMPGIYRATVNGRTLNFAVNLDAGESRTTAMAMEELDRLGVPLKAEKNKVQERAALQRSRIEMENQQKIWRWLILAALAAVLTESWLAGRLSRRPVPVG